MIRITGNKGEGAGLFVNIAVKKLLENHLEQFPNCLCFLIDDSTEFYPLVQELQGVNIDLSGWIYPTPDWPKDMVREIERGRFDYSSYVLSLINKKKFFRFIVDWDCEDEFSNIERLANEIQNKYHLKVFVIHKSVNC